MVGGQLPEGRVHLYSFWAVIILAGVGFSVTQLSEDDTPIRNPSELTGSPCQTRWDHYQGLSLVWHLQWVDIHSFSLQGRAPTEISVMKGQEAGLSSLGHIKLWATWKQPLHSSRFWNILVAIKAKLSFQWQETEGTYLRRCGEWAGWVARVSAEARVTIRRHLSPSPAILHGLNCLE